MVGEGADPAHALAVVDHLCSVVLPGMVARSCKSEELFPVLGVHAGTWYTGRCKSAAADQRSPALLPATCARRPFSHLFCEYMFTRSMCNTHECHKMGKRSANYPRQRSHAIAEFAACVSSKVDRCCIMFFAGEGGGVKPVVTPQLSSLKLQGSNFKNLKPEALNVQTST